MSFLLFCKDKRAGEIPEKEKISIKVQLKAVMQNRPYLLALVGQVLFGFTLYGRNADILYYFTYVEGDSFTLKKNITSIAIPVSNAKTDAVLPLLFNLRNTVSGKKDLEMMDSSMHLFLLEIKSEWP